MPAKTFYLQSATDASGWEVVDESAVAAATRALGWVVSTGNTNHSELQANTERAATTFVGTTVPDGTLDTTLKDAFRTLNPLNGNFASGNWEFHFVVRAVTTGGAQNGRIRFRLIKANADGSSATEITAGQQQASLSGVLTTSADFDSTLTFNPGAFSMANQYLFIQIAWERTVAGGMTSSDCDFRTGSSSTVGTRIITSTFTAITEADGSSTGVGASSIAGAPVLPTGGSAAGAATASADGENAAGGGLVEADGSSSGTGAAAAVGAALWDTLSAAAGLAAAAAVALAVFLGDGSAAGAGAASAAANAFASSGAAAAGSASASGISGAIACSVASSSGSGSAAGAGENGALTGSDGASSGSSAAAGQAAAVGASTSTSTSTGAASAASGSTTQALAAASGVAVGAAVGENGSAPSAGLGPAVMTDTRSLHAEGLARPL